MLTEWDYSDLADAYLQRPDYSEDAVNSMLKITETNQNANVCDVGAGVAHLTLMLAKKGFKVNAVEPNDAMRKNGIIRTKDLKNVQWFEGVGENTKQENKSFDLVTFGSSFNVCDRQKALLETSRILKDKGWFACMWNHRDLKDNIQNKIEEIIKSVVDGYGYGTRREDQVDEINKSNLFGNVIHLSSDVIHTQTIDDCIEAWRSHATLERQAGEKFLEVITKIEKFLLNENLEKIQIPYKTNIWLAQLK